MQVPALFDAAVKMYKVNHLIHTEMAVFEMTLFLRSACSWDWNTVRLVFW